MQVLPVKGVGLFSTSEDGSVRMSDLDRRKLVHNCRLHVGPVHAVSISSPTVQFRKLCCSRRHMKPVVMQQCHTCSASHCPPML